MTVALVIFIFSALGLVGLFALKIFEARTGRHIASRMRNRADEAALVIDHLISSERTNDLSKNFAHLVWSGAVSTKRFFSRAYHRYISEPLDAFVVYARKEAPIIYTRDPVSTRDGLKPAPWGSLYLRRVLSHKQVASRDRRSTAQE